MGSHNIETLSRILGIRVEDSSTKRNDVVRSLRDHGIEANRSTISRLRGESPSTSGEKIARRLRGSETLGTNNAILKDKFYFEVTQVGLDIRVHPSRDRRRWENIGFTKSIAETLDVSSQDLRRCFRAMRTDFVLEELAHPNHRQISYLLPTAKQFIGAYTEGARRSPNVVAFDDVWDRKTVIGFYKSLYQCCTDRPSSLKVWTPFEVEILNEFYCQRMNGDEGSPLSLYDQMVIEDDLHKVPEWHLVNIIRESTGIKYDPSVTYNHLNVLLYGKP